MQRSLLLLFFAAVFFACFVQLTRTQPPLYIYPATYYPATQSLSVDMAYASSQTERAYERRRFLNLDSGDILTWDELEPVEPGIMFYDSVHVHPMDPSPSYCGLAAVKDSKGTLQKVPFRFPAYPTLLEGRYLVGTHKRSLYFRDLRTDRSVQSVELSRRDINGWVHELEDLKGIFAVYINRANTPAETKIFGTRTGKLEQLFELKPSDNVVFGVDGKLLCWNAARTTLSEYSLSGELIGPYELSEEISACLQRNSTSSPHTFNGLLSIADSAKTPTQYEHFYLETRQKLNVPSDRLVRRFPGKSVDQRFDIFYSPKAITAFERGSLVGFDRELNKAVWDKDFNMEVVEWGRLGDQAFVVDKSFGLTVQMINAASGKVEQLHQPFFNTVFLIPCLCLSALASLAVWTSTPLGQNHPLSTTLVIASLLPTCFAIYLRYWHLLPGYPNVAAFNYSHGTFVGLTLGLNQARMG